MGRWSQPPSSQPSPESAVLPSDRRVIVLREDFGQTQALPTLDSGAMVVAPSSWLADLQALRRVTGEHRLTLILPQQILETQRGLDQELIQQGERAGFELQVLSLDEARPEEIAGLLDGLSPGAGGIYLAPGLPGAAEDWAEALSKRGLPGVSGRGPEDVEAGVLVGPRRDRLRPLARMTALALREQLSSPTAAVRIWAVPAAPDLDLRIHRGTAERLEIPLPWDLRLDAELVGHAAGGGANLDLGRALREAVDANLGLAARRVQLAADATELQRAAAARRPQLSFNLQGTQIDQDSARSSFGNQPERRLLATGEASWVLFSEPLTAAVEIEERLQLARQLEVEQLRLDIALEAGRSYWELLRATARQRVERSNLSLSVATLDNARWRLQAGAADTADVARLEARVAQDRQRLVQAEGQRRAVALRLNELLHRPLEQELIPETADLGPADTETASAEPTETQWSAIPRDELVSDLRRFSTLRQQLVERSRAQSPGVAASEALRRAAERRQESARRAFYLPTVDLSAGWTVDVAEGGAGDEVPMLDLGLGGANPFPPATDDRWTLSLTATLPLTTGGRRQAERARADLEVEAAEVLQEQAEERARLRALLALSDFETASVARRQAEQAALAAERALTVVSAAYEQGTETLTTLLDAQNGARSARLESTDATYALHQRWLEVERTLGGFSLLDPQASDFLTRTLSSLETR
ncbi:MAG: TolC family protein [Acidobacteriota bacterium]